MNYVNNMGNDWRMPTWNNISYVFGFLNWSNGASEIKNYLGNFLTIFWNGGKYYTTDYTSSSQQCGLYVTDADTNLGICRLTWVLMSKTVAEYNYVGVAYHY